MVKFADIPEYERNHLMSKLLPPLGYLPWVLNERALSEKIASRVQLKRSTGNWTIDRDGDDVKAANPIMGSD